MECENYKAEMQVCFDSVNDGIEKNIFYECDTNKRNSTCRLPSISGIPTERIIEEMRLFHSDMEQEKSVISCKCESVGQRGAAAEAGAPLHLFRSDRQFSASPPPLLWENYLRTNIKMQTKRV